MKKDYNEFKDIDDLRDLILDYFVNDEGDVDISDLDFNDFDGRIIINGIRTNSDLRQGNHKVKGHLFQDFQKVDGSLFQDSQVVSGDLWQDSQEINGNLIQGNQKVSGIIKNYNERL